MKKQICLIALAALLHSCQQPAQDGKVEKEFTIDSVTLIFKDAPVQNRRDKPDGSYTITSARTLTLVARPPFNSKIPFTPATGKVRNGTITYTPKTEGYDTLSFYVYRPLIEMQHLYAVSEAIFLPVVAGDTLLITYDTTGYPQLKSLVNDQYTRLYNLPFTTPGYRFGTAGSIYSLAVDGFARFTLAMDNTKHKLSSPEFTQEQNELKARVSEQYRHYMRHLTRQIDSLRTGNELSRQFYHYYNARTEIEKLLVSWDGKREQWKTGKNNRQAFDEKRRDAQPLLNDSLYDITLRYISLLNQLAVPEYYAKRMQMNYHDENVEALYRMQATDSLPTKSKKQMMSGLLNSIIGNAQADTVLKYLNIYVQFTGDSLAQKRLIQLGAADSMTYKDDLKLISLQGDTILFQNLLKQYKGKVVYIDYWGSWCTPCRREMPAAKKLRQEYKNKNVVFLYLALRDKPDDWKAAVKKEETHILGQNYIIHNSTAARMIDELKIQAVPRFMIYDPNGKLVNTDAPRPGTKEIRQQLDKYLKQ